MTDTSVVITCKGRLDHLKLVLPRWAEQDIPVEVVVVDYACPQGTASYVASEWPQFRCVKVARDSDLFNHSRAVNIGIRHATANQLLASEGDVLVGPDYARRMTAELTKGADLVLWSHYTDQGGPRHNGQCAFTRDLWHRLRGWDESFEGWGWDDIDFYNRAAAIEAKIVGIFGVFHIPHGDDDRGRYHAMDCQTAVNGNRERSRDLLRAVNPGGYGEL